MLALLIPLLKSEIQRFQKQISTRVIGARGVCFFLVYVNQALKLKRHR